MYITTTAPNTASGQGNFSCFLTTGSDFSCSRKPVLSLPHFSNEAAGFFSEAGADEAAGDWLAQKHSRIVNATITNMEIGLW